MTTPEYSRRISNMAYHMLCKCNTPHPKTGLLLGLGMKFCIQRDRPNMKDYIYTFKRLEKDIRTKYLIENMEKQKQESIYPTYTSKAMTGTPQKLQKK